jgi:hypothetical protein
VSSIQILGEESFPRMPAGGAPSLDSLFTALRAGGDEALQYLTPDVEIYVGGKTVTFRHGALRDIDADTSDLAIALFRGTSSVRGIIENPATRAGADVSIRMWERGVPGWVWKFPAPTPISELVFKASAGQWRLWEVRYR